MCQSYTQQHIDANAEMSKSNEEDAYDDIGDAKIEKFD